MKTRLLSLLGVLVTFGATLVAAIIDGILGNRADSIFVEVLPPVENFIVANIFTCICIAIIFAICLLGNFYWQHRYQNILHTSAILYNTLELDNSFLRLLLTLSSAPQDEQKMRRVLTKLLHDAIGVFGGEVQHAAIVVCNPPQNAECIASYGLSQAHSEGIRPYIGSEQHLLDTEKVIAEEKWSSDKIVVHSLMRVNNHWVHENDLHRKRVAQAHQSSSHISVVNVPIIEAKTASQSSKACQAILCLESTNKQMLDDKEIRSALHLIATRVALIMTLYK